MFQDFKIWQEKALQSSETRKLEGIAEKQERPQPLDSERQWPNRLFFCIFMVQETPMNQTPNPENRRKVISTFAAVNTSDGAGVRLKRSIGMPDLSFIDPFLLLDEFSSENPDDYIAGFPPHPHRGFQTVTYMLNGRMQHRDSAGHTGELQSGGVQWMSAGRGVMHSEMPLQTEGRMRGFQLWVNLPRAQKMSEPRYQEFSPDQIPEKELSPGSKIKVIAGEVAGLRGPVSGVTTDPLYIDVTLAPESEFFIETETAHNAFAYPFEGSVEFAGTLVETGIVAQFSKGAGVLAKGGPQGGRFILLAAQPIEEPVYRGGPFVMNTREEVRQAFEDFQDMTME